MTYSQHHHHSESALPEKVRKETTTTTISTTTTTASTMPLTSDSEPTMYTSSKALHYRPSKNNDSNLHHRISTADVDHGQRQQNLHYGHTTNNGRSPSPSSTSSSNGSIGIHANGKTSSGPGLHPKQSAAGLHHHPNGSSSNVSIQGRQQAHPTHTSNGSNSKTPRAGADPSDYSTGVHSWPILFAVVPPLGALVFGKSDIWSDILTLALIAFFLYNIIKVPWELYYAARTRRVILSSVSVHAAPLDPVLEKRRQDAAASLRRQEFFSLLLVLASPFLGGYTLQYLKTFFSSYEDYLSALNIELFIIASGIRPLTHLVSLLKARALHLQEQVHYPDTEVENLQRKVAAIEGELTQLRRAFATKREVLQVQDSVEPTLHQLTKQIKRHDKKETLLRSYTEERFAAVDEKLREYDTILSYRLTEEQHRSSGLLFLPLNIVVAMIGYCTFFLPSRLTGQKQQPMLQSSSTPAAIGNGGSGDHLLHAPAVVHVGKSTQSNGRPLLNTSREATRVY
ncbi:hypothetical protein BGZ94_002619 [Podila epigama]|nr:hypothetical protein BGZ94_002619 [Podila epigama]